MSPPGARRFERAEPARDREAEATRSACGYGSGRCPFQSCLAQAFGDQGAIGLAPVLRDEGLNVEEWPGPQCRAGCPPRTLHAAQLRVSRGKAGLVEVVHRVQAYPCLRPPHRIVVALHQVVGPADRIRAYDGDVRIEPHRDLEGSDRLLRCTRMGEDGAARRMARGIVRIEHDRLVVLRQREVVLLVAEMDFRQHGMRARIAAVERQRLLRQPLRLARAFHGQLGPAGGGGQQARPGERDIGRGIAWIERDRLLEQPARRACVGPRVAT